MLIEVHKHIVSELDQSSRTDTVFVVSAVLFNLVVLGINWGVASNAHDPKGQAGGGDFILAILVLATLIINAFCIRALLAGNQTRTRLVSGLMAMYRDQGVDKYYDPSLLDIYSTRYKLFTAVLGVLAAIAVIVPLVARLSG
jgi:uncharacterized membrane protein YhaH (DUF805 family)